jgi:hypothetical protein
MKQSERHYRKFQIKAAAAQTLDFGSAGSS